jgi:hypothetical protein
MNNKKHLHLLVVVVTVLILAALPLAASASHSWGGYHWARTANPFTIKLGDNVSGPWDSMFVTHQMTGVSPTSWTP